MVGSSIKRSASSFEDFVQLCEEQQLLCRPAELTPEDVCDGFTDEITLRRFFIGCGSNPDAAFKQFKESIEIRNSISDVSIHEHIDVNHYEATRKLYPHWTGRRDKRGLPICMFDLTCLDRDTIAEYRKIRDTPSVAGTTQSRNEEPSATQRAFAFHDTMTRFILPLCTSMQDRPNPETPISSAVYLVDISSFGFKQALDLKGYAQDISKLLATSFPEVVDSVLVLNAPSYFGKIWSILKRWVDPRTADKLVILSTDQVLPTLQSSIDPTHIPKQFGGQFVFEHGTAPMLDEALCQRLVWMSQLEGRLPVGPIKWINDDQGNRLAVAVGTDNGEPRRDVIASLKL